MGKLYIILKELKWKTKNRDLLLACKGSN